MAQRDERSRRVSARRGRRRRFHAVGCGIEQGRRRSSGSCRVRSRGPTQAARSRTNRGRGDRTQRTPAGRNAISIVWQRSEVVDALVVVRAQIAACRGVEKSIEAELADDRQHGRDEIAAALGGFHSSSSSGGRYRVRSTRTGVSRSESAWRGTARFRRGRRANQRRGSGRPLTKSPLLMPRSVNQPCAFRSRRAQVRATNACSRRAATFRRR